MSPLPALVEDAALPGVRVVPVVRGRLAFAQVALEALEAERPDVLAVDLPGFLTGSLWLETALARLPLTTSLVIKRAGDNLLLPFTPSDACSMAAWQARRRQLPFECVDGVTILASQKDRAPVPDSGLSDDAPLPHSLEDYFSDAWSAMEAVWAGLWRRCAAMARGGEIAHNLERLAAHHGRVLFIADYRTWWVVRKFLRHPSGSAAPPLRKVVQGALIFEDALALWHAGLMEMPRIVHEFYRSAEGGLPFDPLAAAAAILGPHAGLLESFLPGSQWRFSALLDHAETHSGNAAEIAGQLLSYPAATGADAADRIPSFGSITSQGIGPCDGGFDPLDAFEAKPYYEPAPAEITTFFPPEERVNRAGWGPTAMPFVTRTEACRLSPSNDNRWSADGHAEQLARAAAVVREYVAQLPLDPPLAILPDRFTPIVFAWSNESDGDVRSVDDSNLTRRRVQLGELPEGAGPAEAVAPADCIHTLCATRTGNAAWWGSMVQYDFASSIATLYSGPETGPARYDAVTSNNPPQLVCRQNPSSDPDIVRLGRDQAAAAFAVKWARNLVIAAVHTGWQPSPALLKMADARGVRILIVPIEVVPRTMTIRLRRRVFVSRTIRTDQGVGRRLENRFANWRLHAARG